MQRSARLFLLPILTFAGACDRQPDPLSVVRSEPEPPLEGRIAFVRLVFSSAVDDDGQRLLYVANADGSGEVKLTHSSDFSDESPTWSPDGKRIAFSRWVRDETQGIWIMNADGTGQSKLMANATDPSWSPDGTRIAFVRAEGSRDGIFVMNADGTGVSPFLAAGTNPEWSPDGVRIAFTVVRTTHGAPSGISMIKADGSGLTPLTTQIGVLPAWSPDGRRIVFQRAYNSSEVGVINADGTGVSAFTHPGSEPEWSPDGGYIAFALKARFDRIDNGIWVMKSDGSGVRRIATGILSQPAWTRTRK